MMGIQRCCCVLVSPYSLSLQRYTRCLYCVLWHCTQVQLIDGAIACRNRAWGRASDIRDGILQACYATASLAELRESLGGEYSSFTVIAIDEAQFLPDLLQFCAHGADIDHKHILVAGLDGDFRRQRFGQVGNMLLLP